MSKNQKNRFPFTVSQERIQSGYAAVEIQEGFNFLSNVITDLKEEISLLTRKHNEFLLQKLTDCKKDFLTIEDVESLFDISKRTQQEERSALKLGHLKKIDGNKILYSHQHIKEYLQKHYQEVNQK